MKGGRPLLLGRIRPLHLRLRLRLGFLRRRFEVDMSPEAIEGRLREVAQLWKFWQSLRNFTPDEDAHPKSAEDSE